MTAPPDRYAVIGHPVAHSRSPQIHALFAAQTGQALRYERIEAPLDGFAPTVQAFFAAGGRGCNVTLPFKAQAAALAQQRSARAALAQAANTLWLHDGRLQADNTDGIGLVNDLQRNLQWVLGDMRMLILGAGGAVAGVCGPLIEAGVARLCLANRTVSKAQQLAAAHAALAQAHRVALRAAALHDCDGPYDLVVNAVSAGLHGELVAPPAAALHGGTRCYDMAYASGRDTPFVAWAKAQGLRASDGLGMLVEQAAESFFLWRGMRPATAPVLAQLRSDDAAAAAGRAQP